MNSDKVSAERDALLLALRRAEEEISRTRTGQQKAEAKLAELLSGRTPMIVPVRNDGTQATLTQAQAAQKRAEGMARTLEEQLRGRNAELGELRSAFDALQAETDELRSKNEELQKQAKQLPQRVAPAPAPAAALPNRNEVKSLRDELDKAWTEIHRLRALVVKVASEARKGIVPEDPFPAPASKAVPPASKAAPRSAAVPRPAPSAPPARPQSSVNYAPKSGARRAA